jgi:transposase InsO family protein
MMVEMFKEEIATGKVFIYIDDVIIATKDLAEHHRLVYKVLQCFKENNLYLKPEKCQFERTQIEYLGMIISYNKVAMDPIKVQGVVDWPIPKSKQDVQSFLGFCNFYRWFIKDFSKIARPMHGLTGDVPFIWNIEHQLAFENLQTAVTTTLVLIIPNRSDPFKLEMDASQFAIGAVLSQQVDDIWKPVAFLSKPLSETQRNYQIYDRELMAIVLAFEAFRHYLIGHPLPVEVWTDHANLQYFRESQKLNRQQACWLTQLQDYDYTLHHIPGKANSKADILSRRAGFDKREDDNKEVTLLKPMHFRKLYIRVMVGFTSGMENVIRDALDREGREFPEETTGWSHDPAGLWEYYGRLYIPKDDKLRELVLSSHHDTPLAGHPGDAKTLEKILRTYWWPTIKEDVKKYVTGCPICQWTKPTRMKTRTVLHPFSVPTRPWEWISMDIVGPLPESNGYDALFVVVDYYSKAIKLEPITIEATAQDIAKVLRQQVFCDHGLPKVMVHDRDTKFVSQWATELNRLLGIKQNPSTAYHPETDGQTERVNQEIEKYLRAFVSYQQDDWTEWLDLAEFVYNDRTHSTTQQSPFYVMHGQHPWKGDPTPKDTKVQDIEERIAKLKEIRKTAEEAWEHSKKLGKAANDRRSRRVSKFQISTRPTSLPR